MRAIPWNTGWTYSHLGDEKNKQTVTLPHDAMLGEKKSATAAGAQIPDGMRALIIFMKKKSRRTVNFRDRQSFLNLKVCIIMPRCGLMMKSLCSDLTATQIFMSM